MIGRFCWVRASVGCCDWLKGLVGRRPDATGSRILQGRDVRSIRVLVPDAWGLDQNFHDVTIVDMGDVPEVSVSLPDLSVLHEQWPPAVFRRMVWLQQDLEMMPTPTPRNVFDRPIRVLVVIAVES